MQFIQGKKVTINAISQLRRRILVWKNTLMMINPATWKTSPIRFGRPKDLVAGNAVEKITWFVTYYGHYLIRTDTSYILCLPRMYIVTGAHVQLTGRSENARYSMAVLIIH